MSLDARLWEQLQEHGVYEAHLRMLLRLLSTQRNGWFGLHYVHGQIRECDARLVFPAREYEVERVGDTLLGSEGAPRGG